MFKLLLTGAKSPTANEIAKRAGDYVASKSQKVHELFLTYTPMLANYLKGISKKPPKGLELKGGKQLKLPYKAERNFAVIKRDSRFKDVELVITPKGYTQVKNIGGLSRNDKILLLTGIGLEVADILLDLIELNISKGHTVETEIVANGNSEIYSDPLVSEVIGNRKKDRVFHYFNNASSLLLLFKRLESIKMPDHLIEEARSKFDITYDRGNLIRITFYPYGKSKDANASSTTAIIRLASDNEMLNEHIVDKAYSVVTAIFSGVITNNTLASAGEISPLLAATVLYILSGGSSTAAVLAALCCYDHNNDNLENLARLVSFFEPADDIAISLLNAGIAFINGLPLGISYISSKIGDYDTLRIDLIPINADAPFGLQIEDGYSEDLKMPNSTLKKGDFTVDAHSIFPVETPLYSDASVVRMNSRSSNSTSVNSFSTKGEDYYDTGSSVHHTSSFHSSTGDSGFETSEGTHQSLLRREFSTNKCVPGPDMQPLQLDGADRVGKYSALLSGAASNCVKSANGNHALVSDLKTVGGDSLFATEGCLITEYSGKFLNSSVEFRLRQFLSVKDLPMLRLIHRTTRLSYDQILFMINLPVTESLIQGVINEQS